MPEQLKDLLDKIHKEGIKAAEEKTRQIETEAQLKAQKIVNDAKRQAQSIIEGANLESEKLKESAEASIKQAARNLMISVKNEILSLFDKIIKVRVADSLTDKQLALILGKAIDKYIENNAQASNVKVLLKKADLDKLRGSFIARLKKKFKDKIEIKPLSNIKAGFLISFDKGKSYFDFTDEALAESLSAYLNQELSNLLKESIPKPKKK